MYKRTLHTATRPIKVYKILRRKIPNKFNGYKYGVFRSFDNPDRYKEYNIGESYSSELSLNKVVQYWLHSFYDTKTEIVGITSLASKPTTVNKVQWYHVVVVECTIPIGSKYYISQDGKNYLSDKLTINTIVTI